MLMSRADRVRLVLVPWTQALVLQWRPELRFYEVRYKILRRLEDAGVLRAFRVANDSIDARTTQGYQLSVQQHRASLVVPSPTADAEGAWSMLATAFNEIQPSRVRSVEVLLQHLLPLQLGFEEAVAAGQERLLALPAAGELIHGDWAVLVDGQIEGEEVSIQTEFGIVRAEEVPARLARSVGRIRGPQGAPAGPVDPSLISPVSLFADSAWERSLDGSEDPLGDTRKFWTTSLARAGRLVQGLHHRLIAADTTGGDQD